MALMKISEYQNQFTPDSRPDVRTVKSWILRKEIYGEKRGRLWYVDPTRPIEATSQPANTENTPKMEGVEMTDDLIKILEAG